MKGTVLRKNLGIVMALTVAAARQDKGDIEGAIADFSMAVKLDPDYAEVMQIERRALLLLRKDHDAAQDFELSLAWNKELKAVLEERIKKIDIQRSNRTKQSRPVRNT